MKKKISIVTKGNYPYGGAGATYVRNLGLALHFQGYDVQIILTYGNIDSVNIASNEKLKELKSISLKSVNIYKKGLLQKIQNSLNGSFNFVFYIIKMKLKKEVDVIINYDIFFSSAIIVLLLTKILKIKLIFVLPEYYTKPEKHKIKYYDFICGINWLASYSDGLVVLSTYMQNLFLKNKKYKRSILLVPNIIELRDFERVGIMPYCNNKTTIGYAGTPTNKDGIHDLLLGFSILAKRNKNVHLLIIGDSTAGYSVIPELKIFAKKLGILENTSFTGLIPYSLVPDLISSCDILALTRNIGITSLAGFPTKLGEYFASKKPVLITKVGDMGYYFSDGVQVVMSEPADIESIAKGFERLIGDTVLSKRIALNGYQWAVDNLEYKNVSKKLQTWLDAEILCN